MLLKGRILFHSGALPFSGATAHVTVEDTTYTDARAVRVSSWTRDDVAYPRDAAGIPFEILIDPDPPPHRRYTLRVLIDVDGDGAVGQGDYLNTEAVPVRNGQTTIDVRVKRAGA